MKTAPLHNNDTYDSQPAVGGSKWNSKGTVDDLQKRLSDQMIERQKIEQQFWQMGNFSKSRQQIEKKKEIEQNLAQTNSNIHSIKMQLREMNIQKGL